VVEFSSSLGGGHCFSGNSST